MSDVIRISPFDIRLKLVGSQDHIRGTLGGDWDLNRVPLPQTTKFRSVYQHFILGLAWEDTILFRKTYAVRFGSGQSIRGASDMGELLVQYRQRMADLRDSLTSRGFVSSMEDGSEMTLPHVFIARDGEKMLGNNGNHRLAIARLIELDEVTVEVRARHQDAP